MVQNYKMIQVKAGFSDADRCSRPFQYLLLNIINKNFDIEISRLIRSMN